MSFRNLMEACNRAFLLCLIEWKVPLMSKCKHFSSTLLWPLLACLLQLISARSIQSNFQDEYNAVLAPFSSTKRRQGLGGGGGERERERTYNSSKEVYEEVIFRKISFPKRYVDNPSFICSIFNFSLLEFFYGLKDYTRNPFH